MNFTDAKIKSLKRQTKRYIEWENGHTGLGVRVSPAGRKTFIFMYRFNGRARMMSLGIYPSTTLHKARLDVAQAKTKIAKDIDPGCELVEKKIADRTAHTVTELVEEYLDKWARPRKRSAAEDERILRKDVIPEWGRLKAKSIKRRDVITLLDKIVDRGAPIQANRTLATVRKMFNFAIGRDIVETSPCTAIPAPSKENQRDRVLTENEIKTFWTKLDNARMSEGSRLALKLQLVTAQRKGEVLASEWSEFDFDECIWIIPAEKAKNGLLHRVPLSDMALELLELIKKESGESGWLFPSARHSSGHVVETSVDLALRRNDDVFKLERFTPHDLRRTAASQLTAMGVSRLVVSKILNHVETGVTVIYDRHGYDDEKRQALDTWSRKLDSILTGKRGKVIPLSKRA